MTTTKICLLSTVFDFMKLHDHYQALIYNESQCEQQKQARFAELNPHLMAMLYSIIFIFSTIGNAIVIFVMCFRARSCSVTSMLITNLAFSDLIMCFTSLWITPLQFYLFDWPWGSVMCHLFPLCQAASIFNSALTLLAISVDRYYSVCRPESSVQRLFNLTSKTSRILLIVIIWLGSTALATPYTIYMRVVKSNCGLRCAERWDNVERINLEMRVIYGFISIIIQFVIPMAFIGYSYLKIYLYLQRQCKQSNFRLRIVSTKKGTLFRMLFLMVSAFAICWMPMTFLNMMRDLHLIKHIQPFHRKFMISHVIAMVATTANPLIYAFMNMTFRDEFARLAPEIHIKLCSKRLLCRRRRSSKRLQSQQLDHSIIEKMNTNCPALEQGEDLDTFKTNRNSFDCLLNTLNRPKSIKTTDKTAFEETTFKQNTFIEL